MICGTCRGDGYRLIQVQKNGRTEYEPEDCPDCLGVGEIMIEVTPQYPDSHGSDDYDINGNPKT